LNTYSFFEPLDVQVFHATRMWAEQADSPIMSGFCSWQTLAYLTWTPSLDAMPAAQQLVVSDQAARAASQGWQRLEHWPGPRQKAGGGDGKPESAVRTKALDHGRE